MWSPRLLLTLTAELWQLHLAPGLVLKDVEKAGEYVQASQIGQLRRENES
jgi:hypothetical protein